MVLELRELRCNVAIRYISEMRYKGAKSGSACNVAIRYISYSW